MTIRSLYPASRPSLDLNFAKTKRLDPRITFSRASTGTYFGSDGLVKSAAVNEARFDHTPSTGESLGLLVEEARTNLVTYSEHFNDATWTKTYPPVEANAFTAPDGTFTADRVIPESNSVYVSKGVTLTAAAYTASIYARANAATSFTLYLATSGLGLGASCAFNLSNGTAGSITHYGSSTGFTSSIQALSGGWYRCSITGLCTVATWFHQVGIFNNQNNSMYFWGAQLELGSFPTSYIPTPATFTSRASSATYYDANGVIQTAGIDVARDNAYFPDSNGVMRPAGLLLEAAGTNLVTYSEQFDNAAWGKSAVTVTANTVAALDGSSTAEKLIESASSAYHTLQQNISGFVAGTSYTLTLFAKAGERSRVGFGGSSSMDAQLGTAQGVVFDLTGNGSVVVGGSGASIQKLSNGWYRCSYSWSQLNTGNYYVAYGPVITNTTNYSGDGTSGIYIWGAQLEASPYPTSYIATAGATVTRSADVSSSATVTRSADVASITGTNFSSWYRQDEGSVLIRASSKAEQYLLEIPSSNGINYNVLAINSARAQFVSVNSTTQASIFSPVGTWSLGVLNTASFAYKQDSFAVCSNGSVAATDTSGTVPAVALMDIGRRSNGNNYSCSTISRLTYWPTRLPDSILQSLTQ